MIQTNPFIKGEWIINQNQRIYFIKETYQYPINHGKIKINHLPTFNNFLSIYCGYPVKNKITDNILFFDIETTNLCANSSCFVFLVGLCWFENSGLTIIQLFLDDFSSEPLLLSHLEKIIDNYSMIATYNGKSFDVPALKTRLIMNGMNDIFVEKVHFDLLHISRTIFKNKISSFKLNNIEEEVLEFKRSYDDIPGWLIPQVYFDYLETGQTGLLNNIFYHNKIDVISLASLFFLFDRLMDSSSITKYYHKEDLIGIVRLIARTGNYKVADQYSSNIFQKHTQLKNMKHLDAKTLEELAMISKKIGNWSKAVNIWDLAVENGSFFACVELAKFFEHKEKDYDKAIEYVKRALNILKTQKIIEPSRDDLDKRFNRLSYKKKRT